MKKMVKHVLTFVGATVLMFANVMVSQAAQTGQIGYTIQAGAFQEQTRAEKFTDKLRGQKLEAAYHRKDNGLFAVTFGDFPTWDAARQRARQLKEERLLEAYYIIRPLKNTVFENRSSTQLQSKQHDVDRGRLAARTAERFTGIQYKYGGNNVVEGLDCSAFVKSVYYLIGVNIPRTSQEQFNAGDPVERKDMKEGDLLFFGKGTDRISHVGMYIGNGNFIHAPRRGEPIQITPVDNEKYVQKYVGSRRYL